MAFRQIQRKYSKFISDACKNSSKIGLPRNLRTFPCKRSYTYINDDPIPPVPFNYKFNNEEHDHQRWFHNPKRVFFTLFFFTSSALLGVASGTSVTVPYSERSHFILFNKLLGKIVPEEHTWFEGEQLPPLDPDNITAQRIFQDIFDQALPIEIEIRRSLEENNELAIDVENKFRIIFKTHDCFRRKQGGLGKVNCEIIVLNSDEDACETSGRFGKVYVTTAMLDFYRKHEAMIATKFGIEVCNMKSILKLIY